MRAAARRSVAVLAAILATAALVEFGVRMLLPPQNWRHFVGSSLQYGYHEVYNWTLKPGSYRGPGGAVTVNAHGLRGEPPSERAECRILVLGGSSVFNYAAADSDTWPAMLEDRLREDHGLPSEVVNAGVPGYSTYQSSLRFVSELSTLEPDVVVIYHMWNDLKSYRFGSESSALAYWDQAGRSNAATSILRSRPLLDAVTARSQAITYVRLAAINVRFGDDREGTVPEQDADNDIQAAGLTMLRESLDRIVSRAAAIGADVIIVKQALLATEDLNEELRRQVRLDYLGFDYETLMSAVKTTYEIIDGYAGTNSRVHVLDASVLSGHAEYFTDHVHLTPAGRSALSTIVAERASDVVGSACAG